MCSSDLVLREATLQEDWEATLGIPWKVGKPLDSASVQENNLISKRLREFASELFPLEFWNFVDKEVV